MSARAWIELDLSSIRRNTQTVLGVANVPLMAVVKANGYGHGASAVARAAIEGGARRLGVATASEALALRRSGITAPIQILGAFLEDELDAAVAAGASLTLHEPEDLRRVGAAAWKARRPIGVHIKVNSGMHRHGVSIKDALPLLTAATRDRRVRVEGLMTHLPSAGDKNTGPSLRRVAGFSRLVDWADAAGVLPDQVHAAASVALFRFPKARFSQVRSGIALLGLDPSGHLGSGTRLDPALSIHARITRLQHVPRGSKVGYGGRWVAPRATRLAIVGMGYADGLPYSISGKGASVLIQGRRCPIVGSVMMDYVLVDVTDLPCVPKPGDVATVVGTQGKARIRLEEQSRRAGLIPYAFACALGPRLVRTVTDGQRGSLTTPLRRVA